MKTKSISRRQFLFGAGGAALALPFLPSLLSREARAAGAVTPKAFIGISAWNGLYRMSGPTSQLMPSTTVNPTTRAIIAGRGAPVSYTQTVLPQRTLYSAPLSTIATANGGAISDIIDKNYTPLLGKMLMLQGLDYLGMGSAFHHTGHFGNWFQVATQTSGNAPMATLDYVIANHNKAAGLPSDIVCYTASYADRGQVTSFRADGTANSNLFYNPATLWDSYFANNKIPTNLKKTVVDQVLADYKAVRGSVRLGAADRQKLDTHIALLAQTEADVQKVAGLCQLMRPAASLTDRATILKTTNSVITSLIACGLCTNFMGWAMALNDADPSTWHTDSHAGYLGDNDSIKDMTSYTFMVEQNRSVMNDMCLDLAQKLDAVQLLDSSLIVCIQEHSKRGHECWNIPVIMFGGAGGTLATGKYVDYRDNSWVDPAGSTHDDYFTRKGFPMNQLYATVLQAMGVPPSEFEPLNKAGTCTHDPADTAHPTSMTLCPTKPFKPNSGYGICEIHRGDSQEVNAYSGPGWANYDLSQYLPLVKA
jgi:hypothetical protein